MKVKTMSINQLDENSMISFSTEEQTRYQKINEKKQSNIFEVAFCGHFSAGKSTILNKLLGAEVLPTSPIPTSANLIRILQGNLSLTVHRLEQGDDKVFLGEVPWQQVRKWGMDGNVSSGMTIHAPLEFLGNNGCIVDTPGVDSTDEDHKKVTVEQLYTTDVIVYVMDYNHVQSETNIYFLKQLSTLQKPIYLIINQIDKHDESEIPLREFKTSVEDLMKEWNIHFIAFYFTSMKIMDHSANQYDAFEKQIKAMLYNSNKLLNSSQVQLEKGFYTSVMHRLKEDREDDLNQVHQMIEKLGFHANDLESKEQLLFKLDEVLQFEETIRKRYQNQTGSLYQNVTLFPFTTTELVRSWLETLQPGYKKGLFFSKKKTMEEQERRLELLVGELQDKIKSQLLFHIQSYFHQVDRNELSNKAEFEESIEQLRFNVTAEWLHELVKQGRMSRDYVYTFTREVTNKIVNIIQGKAALVLDLQIKGTKSVALKKEADMKSKLTQLEKLKPFEEKITDIMDSFHQQMVEIDRQFQNLSVRGSFNDELIQAGKLEYPTEMNETFHSIILPENSVIEHEEDDEKFMDEVDFSEEETSKWLNKVKEILVSRNDSSVLHGERKQLLKRIERNENQTYIISLFGAFSAGKSSFANALLGHQIMPVSPNPTTATIHTVKQPETGYPHGTAVILVKSKQALNKEVISISESLDISLDLDSLVDKWQSSKHQFISNWQKTSADYLSTIQTCLKESLYEFGDTITTTIDESQTFVAKETNACLVEKVTLYYDCPLTKKGIMLVDTPGVNSIHARHTNVAFQQLRQSDAIFYLTYYNHAFSKADQYFLQQMDKVNESFGFDKLYFIINAADLANNVGELHGVKHHVREQLKRNGINKPRLYHLSSKQGLSEKIMEEPMGDKQSSFSTFEDEFYVKTILELKLLSFNILKDQVKQISEKLSDTVTFMNQNKEEQLQKQEELKNLALQEMNQVEQVSFRQSEQEVFHELDQFCLYLRQRIKYVLTDYYASIINVSVLTGGSKKELHSQLTGAIQEWRDLGERFLKQELEAISIRLENVLKRIGKQWLLTEKQNITKKLPHVFVDEEVPNIELQVSIQDISLLIETNAYFAYLKSKKDFFENGKVKELKERLISDGANSASKTILFYEERFASQVKAAILELETNLKGRLVKAIYEESVRFDAILDPNEQDEIRKELKALRSLKYN